MPITNIMTAGFSIRGLFGRRLRYEALVANEEEYCENTGTLTFA